MIALRNRQAVAGAIRYLCGLSVLLASPLLLAQGYPAKPIRMIVPFTAGSGSDIVARVLGPELFDGLGRRVVVDNRPGAGGTIGTAIAGAAPADGHTLLLTSSGFTGSQALYPDLPYDTSKDFVGITPVMSIALVLVVAPSLGVKSVSDLIALAKTTPHQTTYASTGVGSGTHYGAELFRRAAGIDATHVPYKGVPLAVNDVMNGRVNFYFPSTLAAVPLVRDRKVIALAITSPQRSPLLPNVPTMAEAGLSHFQYVGWWGLIAPGKVPAPIITKLSREMARVLALPRMTSTFENLGGEPYWTTPEVFAKLISAEIKTRADVFRSAK